MPLDKSPSRAAFVSNLKAELSAGKDRDQALAIAYSVKRRSMAEGGVVQGALDAVRNWGSGVADRGRQLVSNPLEFMKGAVNDVVPSPRELTESFAGLASPTLRNSVMIDPAGKQKMMDMALAGITAYHGTPHAFDKFDMSKVGTGEGAQAYGHGLYFAENPKVAKAYQSNLSQQYVAPDNRTLVPHGDAHTEIAKAVQETGLHPDNARKIANHILDVLEVDGSLKNYLKDYQLPKGFEKPYMAGLEKAQSIVAAKNQGNLLKVDIPDSHVEKMLHWDKPLSEQPENVRKWITESGLRFPDSTKGSQIYDALASRALSGLAPEMRPPTARGTLPDVASQQLKAAGIPGIKYLDQGSRNSGLRYEVLHTDKGFDLLDGDKAIGSFPTRAAADAAREVRVKQIPPETHNYVLFDDQIPKIIGKENYASGGRVGYASGGSVDFDAIEPHFTAIEKQKGLPGGLLRAIVETESNGKLGAVSPKGARGPFQFMPGTAKRFNLKNPHDAHESAIAAGDYLGKLKDMFGGDIPKMLAGYNWGEGNVQHLGLDKAPKETRDYIRKIAVSMGSRPTVAAAETKRSLPVMGGDPLLSMHASAPAEPETNDMAPHDKLLMMSLLEQLMGDDTTDEEVA